MTLFPLAIYESDGIFFEGEAQSLTVPAADGEYGVQALHENVVLAVVPGILHYIDEDGKTCYASVGGGMMRVEDGDVLVLVETAERPEEIDEERARRSEQEAKEAMLAKRSMQEYYIAETKLKREIARLELWKKKDRILS
ncbi:MAG: ATP synthase F1 subunit epsilon [Lachnospiraceae bacterium]|nr:ATP synthase F1 subunit epsilon [Lachnospiraceae bacterium]